MPQDNVTMDELVDVVSQVVNDAMGKTKHKADVDDAIQQVFDAEPDEFLANVMIETKGLSLSERRRIRKCAAIEAEDHSALTSGYVRRQWRNISYALKNNRR
jgi:hypothetical protein